MSFAVTANFHPTLTANGRLDAVQDWFRRVFRRPCHGPSPAYLIDGYSSDYCFTVLLQEVFFDVMDPSRFSSANNPKPADDIPPFLSLQAFYLDDLGAFIDRTAAQGLTLRDIKGTVMMPGARPAPIPHGDMVLSNPQQTGYIYEFFTVGKTPKHKQWGTDIDARFLPAWRIPPVDPDDPLALEYCASHAMVTDDLARLRHLYVDILGGRIIYEGPNAALNTHSVHVALGDGVYELAQPVGDGVGRDSLSQNASSMQDRYHGITFKTADLQRARAHLLAEEVPLVVDTPDLVVTEAAHSAGVYWGFTTKHVPGANRGSYPDLNATL